jgi:hypothetical protein
MENRSRGEGFQNMKKAKTTSPNMLKRDSLVLIEYGFKRTSMNSQRLNRKKVDGMTMRQLDRTKMILLRNSHLCGGYPQKILKGIILNDLEAFSEALVMLSPFLTQ